MTSLPILEDIVDYEPLKESTWSDKGFTIETPELFFDFFKDESFIARGLLNHVLLFEGDVNLSRKNVDLSIACFLDPVNKTRITSNSRYDFQRKSYGMEYLKSHYEGLSQHNEGVVLSQGFFDASKSIVESMLGDLDFYDIHKTWSKEFK